jgi:hypothetical protein
MATTTTTTRSATLPALVYVLAAFGVISGSYGALRAIGSAAMFAKPREVYLAMVTANNEVLKPYVAAAELEIYAHPSQGLVKLWDACAPEAIVRAAFDGLEAGLPEVLADELTRQVKASLASAAPAYLAAA